MNPNTHTQQQLKALKNRIVKESAIEVGYGANIIQQIPDYAVIAAVKEIATTGRITVNTGQAAIGNMIVTEAVRAMNFQDFKDVAPYFIPNPQP